MRLLARPLPTLALSLLLGACAGTTQLSIRNPVDAPSPAGSSSDAPLLAGIVRTDITPPPGMPKAGYSSNGQDGSGFRTRLAARVFYLKAKGGEPAVVVQTDLLAGSSVVHHLVAERIAQQTDVRAHNLAITATHTHAGPGQILGSNFYNTFASNRAGFDPAYTEFLVSRISAAVIEAYRQRRPAKMATGRIDIWGATRNRSLDPYVQNDTVLDKGQAAQKKFYAINPALYMVRIDGQDKDGGYKPMGAFSTFSIHGTGVPQHAEDYNADVWAYIGQELEWAIRENYSGLNWQPVHGAFEGTHGDAAPNIRFGMAGYLEARRVGTQIGQKAWELFKSLDNQLKDQVVIRTAYREVDAFTQPEINGVSLCERPAAGAALAAGATENLTPVLHWIPPFAPGWPRTLLTGSCQGHKEWLGTALLQPLVLPKEGFPHRIPFMLMQFDNLALVPLPFEITTEAGRRIADKVRDSFASAGQPLQHVAVSSLANEYFGYATTPEEYRRQYYEGGHTLYGPQTAPFLAEHSARLASELAKNGKVADLPAKWEFTLDSKQYMAQQQPYQGGRETLAEPEFIDATSNSEPFWRYRWADVPVGNIAWHEPLASVEYSDDGGKTWLPLLQQNRPANDQGYDLGLRHLGKADGGRAEYAAHWFNPEWRKGRQYRFVIEARGKEGRLYSLPFA